MKVIEKNSEKVVIEFARKEYYDIVNWMEGKEAGEMEDEARDALEYFIYMGILINPNLISEKED